MKKSDWKGKSIICFCNNKIELDKIDDEYECPHCMMVWNETKINLRVYEKGVEKNELYNGNKY